MNVRSAAPTVKLRVPTAKRGATSSRRFVLLLVGRFVFFLALFVLWQWATTATYLSNSISTPLETVVGMWELIWDPLLWRSIGFTVLSAMSGLLIAIVLGVTVGLVLSIGPSYYRSASFLIDFLRTIPGLAILPLGILVFGPTMRLDLLMIVFSAVWPILIQTVYAVRQLDRELIETVQTYRVPPLRRFWTVVLPACAPRIATGIRIAASMSLLLAVGTQLLAGSPGLGNLISVYQQNAVYGKLYACIIFTGIIGFLFNLLILRVERKALAWHFTPRLMAETS